MYYFWNKNWHYCSMENKCEEGKVSLEGKYSFVSFLFLFPYAHAHDLFFSFLIHTHKVCVWKEKKFFSSFCYAHAHDSFLSLLYTCMRFLCSTTFFCNDTRTPFASIVHGIGVLCPCHQRLGLSTGTLGHRRPYPPPVHTSPYLCYLCHLRPGLFGVRTFLF